MKRAAEPLPPVTVGVEREGGAGKPAPIAYFYVQREYPDGRREFVLQDRGWSEPQGRGAGVPLNVLAFRPRSHTSHDLDEAFERAWVMAAEHGADRPS